VNLFSPHGHVDLRLLLDGEPFSDSATLFVTPDHYVTRVHTPKPTANVGSYSLLMRAIEPWLGPRPPPELGHGHRRGRPRVKRVNARWLCLRKPDQFEPYELTPLHDILEGDERLAIGYELLHSLTSPTGFRRIVRQS
jgi:hypothetical protein